MPTGDLITRTYQLELNGVLMGAATSYQVDTDGVGGFGLPAIRDSDTPRPMDHGVFVGPDYMDSKPLTIPLSIDADTGAEAEELLLELETAWRAVTDPEAISELAFRLAGDRTYLAFGRPRRFAVKAKDLKSGHIEAVAQFVATDPRIYDAELSTSSSGPGSTTGGLSLPHGFPHGFGSSSPGALQVVNDGNEATYPVATVTVGVGGIAGFTISNVDAGEDFSVTLNLSEADELEVDFAAKTVVLNGTASRIGNVDRPGSEWLSAAPGTTNWAFAISGAGTATLTLDWRSAFVL